MASNIFAFTHVDIAAAKAAVKCLYNELWEGLDLSTGNLGGLLVQQGYMTAADLERCRNSEGPVSYFITHQLTKRYHMWPILIDCIEMTGQAIGYILDEEYERQRQKNLAKEFRVANLPVGRRANYYDREDVETFVKDEIRNTTKNPEKGILIITGEGGIGKTMLMESLLKDTKNKEFFVSECNVNRIFFVNCWNWREKFHEEEFDIEIANQAKQMDPDHSDMFFNLATVIAHYSREQKCCVFVFDDVYNYELLDYFLEKHDDFPICIVITRNARAPLEISRKNGYPVRDPVCRINTFSHSDILDYWKTISRLNDKLDDDKLNELEYLCCGLPLVAENIARLFMKWEDPRDVKKQFDALISLEQKMSTAKIVDKYRSFENVSALVSFSIDKMESIDAMRYFSFLVFNPSEPVSVFDLGVLWQFNVDSDLPLELRKICIRFENQSLVRRIERRKVIEGEKEVDEIDEFNEDQFLVHQLLYEAALKKASGVFMADFDKIMCKLVSGEINREILKLSHYNSKNVYVDCQGEDSMLVVFLEALKHKRSTLLRKMIDRLSVEDLANFCTKKSLKMTENVPFIVYLLNYEKPMVAEEIKSSFVTESQRLVIRILLRIKEENSALMWHVITETSPGKVYGCEYGNEFSFLPLCLAFEYFFIWSDMKWKEYTLIKLDLFKIFVHWMQPIIAHMTAIGQMTIDNKANKPFVQAVLVKDEAIVNAMLLFPEELSRQSILSALVLGIHNGYDDIVMNIYDSYALDGTISEACVQQAAIFGRLEVLKMIYKRRPVKIESVVPGAVVAACKYGHLECVKFFYQEFPDCLVKENQNGDTPFTAAASTGQNEICRYIMQCHPGIIDMVYPEDYEIGFKTTISENLEIVKLVAPHLKSTKQKIIMFNEACFSGTLPSVKYLAQIFPKNVIETVGTMELTSTNWKNNIPIQTAAVTGRLNIIEFLFSKVGYWSHFLALLTATKFGHIDIVLFLLSKNPKLADQRILDMAKTYEHENIIKVLKSFL